MSDTATHSPNEIAAPGAPDKASPTPLGDIGALSQWQLIRRRFSKHRLAVIALRVLVLLYTVAIFVEFFAPYTREWHDLDHMYSPPQLPRLSWQHGLHAYAVRQHIDPITFRKAYVLDRTDVVKLGFLVKGPTCKLWGLIPLKRRFFGAKASCGTAASTAPQQAHGPSARRVWYLLGGDKYGHDLLSRILYGARISLSVGLIGITISFVLGLAIGGVSGYMGGAVDNIIQRGIEILNAFPKLPLWLALGAIMPPDWSPLKVYFGITVVLSLMGWTGLARIVRGKLLSLREEDYAVAARLLGASHTRIIFRHLLPGFTSHIIVSLTLTVPRMILGETSLSFLGLGLRPPVVSWGVLLQDCMNMQVVSNYPWLLLPVVFIIATVLCFNFLGDGLRDAADPYH
ncbi:MAG: ABC transporter permease [Lentisphaerae bacterium]|jgi:peptide/nickel transport system permease protein|nr:ABC transporter permease [Lentisphaerota bacterium]MBT4820503.1 ABC transporter permease [Lentisphaerota bacterium]MBT5608011.1 ABC transporter permease [Lentisphaerota bacterium]MBT7060665.1 ABC transporter permease [Lentisphaerota bacterium]MBT7844095.1 ABC transporter permease [Lentisphaerota bacterium]